MAQNQSKKKSEAEVTTEGGKKLYGAAAAAKQGILYGAAKASYEKKQAKQATEAAGEKKDVKQTAENKTAEKKTAEKKPAEKKTAEKKPTEKKTAENRAADKKTTGKKPTEKKTTEKKPTEKKLYGAAAAAKQGILYGAAKASAEKKAAERKALEDAGKKEEAKNKEPKKEEPKKAELKKEEPGKEGTRKEKREKETQKKETKTGEKKLYGAAAAAKQGVLYGAAKAAAEKKAARIAAGEEPAEPKKTKKPEKKKKKSDKVKEGKTSEKKLYGAAKAAHEGRLFGAAKLSAERKEARLRAMGLDPAVEREKERERKLKRAEQKRLKKEENAKKKSKRTLTWEEEELLFSSDIDDPTANHELDESVQQRYRKKLADLFALAKKRKNVLEFTDVKKYMADLGLDDVHLERVLEILESEGIDVLKTDEDLEDMPTDDDLIIDEEEEVDMDNLDLSVPDSVAIEDPVRMYLKEIGKVPLLTAEEEIALAKRMEKGMIAEKKLRDDRTKMTAEGRQNVMDRIAVYEQELEAIEGDDEEAVAERHKKQELIDNARKMLEQDKLKKKLTEEEKEALKAPIADGEEAKNKLAEANLRLVVSIAKRYVGRGMLFLDLIQEGNLGLIKAVEKFDFRKGFKFSTYATWWIRQAITRAIADQARTIRIPVHMVETINKLIRISRQLLQELGREPKPEEIAEKMNMPVERVREILKISQEPVSLETPIGEEEDSHLGDFIQDDHVPVPADAAAFTLLKEQLLEVLGTLTDREQKVLRLRFGLDDGRARTLEEVGREFNVTRERIRQIEAKALRKLRHPSRSRKLKDYLD